MAKWFKNLLRTGGINVKNPKYWQQGDCLLKETDSIPSNATKTPTLVLVESAVTNHTHRAHGAVEQFKLDGKAYLNAAEPFEVLHEEHKPITIPAGKYVIEHVQEYDHFTEEARAVAD